LWATATLAPVFPPRDFVEYWSAARVLLDGGNPYDDAALLAVQRVALNDPELAQPVLLWTPPQTLVVYLPFGMLPFGLAHSVWLLVQCVLFLASAELLWRASGRPAGLRGPAWLLPVLFSPVFWNLHFGQNTAFLVFGLAGFLWARTQQRFLLAGLFVSLTAIKPHLLAAFGIVLIFDASTRHGRRVLFAGTATLLLAAGIALLLNPSILQQFTDALRRPTTDRATSLQDWDVPLLSYQFRWWMDRDRFAWQFAPCILAMLVAVISYWRMHSQWDWPTQLPRLVLLSLLGAPYGGWIFDTTILLVPLFAGFVHLARIRQPVWVAAYSLALLGISFHALTIRGLADSLWLVPNVGILYLLVEFLRHRDLKAKSSGLPG
jgi:hypothetical protein